jgi:uncharacterized membrane protein YgcG
MTWVPARARRYPGRLALAIVTVCVVAFAAAAVDVPYLTGRVTDNAEILDADARTRLDELLRAHEQATGNQIAVLTVPTLDGESIEDFSARVFGTWKLGQKSKDNGVLVVVVPRDRRMRIEVGYGLEGVLPDAAASRIVRDVMTPRFKTGDFAGGIEEGVKAIIATLTGQASPRARDAGSARDAAQRSALRFQGLTWVGPGASSSAPSSSASSGSSPCWGSSRRASAGFSICSSFRSGRCSRWSSWA